MAHSKDKDRDALLQEYGIAEDAREILRQEQEHQIDLVMALGIDVPRVQLD